MKKTLCAVALLLSLLPAAVSAAQPKTAYYSELVNQLSNNGSTLENGKSAQFDLSTISGFNPSLTRFNVNVYLINDFLKSKSKLPVSVTKAKAPSNSFFPLTIATRDGQYYGPSSSGANYTPNDPSGSGYHLEVDLVEKATGALFYTASLSVRSIEGPELSCLSASPSNFYSGIMCSVTGTESLPPTYSIDVYVVGAAGTAKIASLGNSDLSLNGYTKSLTAPVFTDKLFPAGDYQILSYLSYPGKGVVAYSNQKVSVPVVTPSDVVTYNSVIGPELPQGTYGLNTKISNTPPGYRMALAYKDLNSVVTYLIPIESSDKFSADMAKPIAYDFLPQLLGDAYPGENEHQVGNMFADIYDASSNTPVLEIPLGKVSMLRQNGRPYYDLVERKDMGFASGNYSSNYNYHTSYANSIGFRTKFFSQTTRNGNQTFGDSLPSITLGGETTPISTTPTVITGNPGAVTISSCKSDAADASNVAENTAVNWTAAATGIDPDATYEYVWSGSDGLTANPSLIATATYGTAGKKTAKLSIKYSGKTVAKVTCDPLTVAKPARTVTTGGGGNTTASTTGSSAHNGTGTISSDATFSCSGVQSAGQKQIAWTATSSVAISDVSWSGTSLAGKTGASVTADYPTSGAKHASAAISVSGSSKKKHIVCSPVSITAASVLPAADTSVLSCTGAVTAPKQITWTAVSSGTAISDVSWLGTGLSGKTGTSATASYAHSGAKSATASILLQGASKKKRVSCGSVILPNAVTLPGSAAVFEGMRGFFDSFFTN